MKKWIDAEDSDIYYVGPVSFMIKMKKHKRMYLIG